MWVGWTVFFTLAAASVGHLISPFADGSGLPQIKSILGGSPLRNFFGWPVMFAKLIGCFFGLAAGLTMGKEVNLCASSCLVPEYRYDCCCTDCLWGLLP